jgi:hypothetical protein
MADQKIPIRSDPFKPDHTPGPWIAAQTSNGDWLIQAASLMPNHVPPWAVSSATLAAVRDAERAKADAQVIAATPDILDALIVCEDYLQTILAPCEPDCECVLHLVARALEKVGYIRV